MQALSRVMSRFSCCGVVRAAVLLVLPSFALVAALQACGGADGCRDGDLRFQDGDVWTCSDGCNSCGCDDGLVSTTGIFCSSPPGPAAGRLICREGGFQYMHGETWVCSDGVTHCSCSDGNVSRMVEPFPDAGQ